MVPSRARDPGGRGSPWQSTAGFSARSARGGAGSAAYGPGTNQRLKPTAAATRHARAMGRLLVKAGGNTGRWGNLSRLLTATGPIVGLTLRVRKLPHAEREAYDPDLGRREGLPHRS